MLILLKMSTDFHWWIFRAKLNSTDCVHFSISVIFFSFSCFFFIHPLFFTFFILFFFPFPLFLFIFIFIVTYIYIIYFAYFLYSTLNMSFCSLFILSCKRKTTEKEHNTRDGQTVGFKSVKTGQHFTWKL